MNAVTRRDSLKIAAASGVAAMTGTAAAQDPPAVEKRPQDRWRAWAVTEGAETKLVVEGIVSEGGPGIVATVKPAAPQGINPKILILKVTSGSLPGFWPAVLTPIPAHYTQSPYKKDQYTSIDVHYPDGTSIMIKTITDAEAGPS